MKKTISQAYSFTKFTEKPKVVEAYQFFGRNFPDTPGVKQFKISTAEESEFDGLTIQKSFYYVEIIPDCNVEIEEGDWIVKDENGSYAPQDTEWFFRHFKREKD